MKRNKSRTFFRFSFPVRTNVLCLTRDPSKQTDLDSHKYSQRGDYSLQCEQLWSHSRACPAGAETEARRATVRIRRDVRHAPNMGGLLQPSPPPATTTTTKRRTSLAETEVGVRSLVSRCGLAGFGTVPRVPFC